MTDRILEAFLTRQLEEGRALAAASDLLHLVPLAGTPPPRYLAEFRCTGLVRSGTGEIVEANRFLIGIWFPDDYLREADPFAVLTWLGPPNVWHPNISDRAPFICAGHLAPGTPLVDILYRLFEIITFNRVAMHDGLNVDACSWARAHQNLFPVDRRSLKRATDVPFEVVEVRR